MTVRALARRLAGYCAALLIATPALAQLDTFRPLPSIHLSPRLGLSTYAGTFDANVDRAGVGLGFGLDVAYQQSNFFGFGVAYSGFYHPRLVSSDLRHDLQAFVRLQHTGSQVGPYVKLGGHLTGGGAKMGYGPLIGLGLNVISGGTYSLYPEYTASFVYPGDALDGQAGASSFDVLGFMGIGVRITDVSGFFGLREVRLGTIDFPEAAQVGVPIRFFADAEEDGPVRYAWMFDNRRYTGTSGTHVFEEAGLYEVEIRATDGGVDAVERRLINVEAPLVAVGAPLAEAPRTDLTVSAPEVPEWTVFAAPDSADVVADLEVEAEPDEDKATDAQETSAQETEPEELTAPESPGEDSAPETPATQQPQTVAPSAPAPGQYTWVLGVHLSEEEAQASADASSLVVVLPAGSTARMLAGVIGKVSAPKGEPVFARIQGAHATPEAAGSPPVTGAWLVRW